MINIKKVAGFAKKTSEDIIIESENIIVKNKEIDDSDIDGEKVMMNLDKGEYFMMNQVGSRIWEIIINPISVKDIIVKLLDEYDVEESACKASVIEFLERLNHAELISIK